MEQRSAKRGPARGREVKRIVVRLIEEVNVATLPQIQRAFDTLFEPPIEPRAVTLVLTQMEKGGQVRRVRPGIFTGKGGNGPLLPLIKAINPTARTLWDTLSEAYSSPLQTRDLAKLAKVDPRKVYPALRLLSAEGLIRWQHGIATATRLHIARSPMLGGMPTDTGLDDRSALPPLQDVDVVLPTRTRQPVDEMTDEERERYEDPLGIFS